MNNSQLIPVTCAIIQYDSKVLAVQRSESMNLPLKWEFPGGKQEAGESLQECLKREIKEELNMDIIVGQALSPVVKPPIVLHPFLCSTADASLHLSEHKTFVWADAKELQALDWAEADIPVLEEWLSL
ncbi:MAG: (deoxy)nucleoside triphosphate pyrophosphohydrolase [Bacteroidetes bacterium]|nr:MAG: (deoxy)nucleoside triphosphate pyrophosphohydrolase [Bacteroidota bacterium]